MSDEVQRVETARAGRSKLQKSAAPGAGASGSAASAIDELLGQEFKGLAKWSGNGFFHLPLELVLELHAHGFTWGATFHSNVDLHHFQLDEPPRKR